MMGRGWWGHSQDHLAEVTSCPILKPSFEDHEMAPEVSGLSGPLLDAATWNKPLFSACRITCFFNWCIEGKS